MSGPLLRVRDLETRFELEGRVVQAVRGVSFEVHRGETVGIVGESGSGKSVTAFSLLRLAPSPPGRIAAGSILLDGADLLAMPERELRAVRGGRVAMVFQDPFTSLNPTMRVGDQIVEAIRARMPLNRRAAAERCRELLRKVHMPDPALRMQQYPHQMSGGHRQRVMIAMAFAMQPALLVADEPTTALDVTVQAQIVALRSQTRRNPRTAAPSAATSISAEPVLRLARPPGRFGAPCEGRVQPRKGAIHVQQEGEVHRHPHLGR